MFGIVWYCSDILAFFKLQSLVNNPHFDVTINMYVDRCRMWFVCWLPSASIQKNPVGISGEEPIFFSAAQGPGSVFRRGGAYGHVKAIPFSQHVIAGIHRYLYHQWEFQDPLYFVGIFPYIGLIYGRYLQFRFLKWPLISSYIHGIFHF